MWLFIEINEKLINLFGNRNTATFHPRAFFFEGDDDQLLPEVLYVRSNDDECDSRGLKRAVLITGAVYMQRKRGVNLVTFGTF